MSRENFIYNAISHPVVSLWFRQMAERTPQSFIRLTSDNSKRLKKILGAPDHYTRQKGRNEMVWKIERDNVVAWLVTGSMGTTMNIYYAGTEDAFLSDKEIGGQAISLFNELLSSLTRSRLAFGDMT